MMAVGCTFMIESLHHREIDSSRRLPDSGSFLRRAVVSAIRILAAAARTIDELAGHHRFRDSVAIHVCDALHSDGDHARNGSPALYFHFDPQLVAGAHGFAKLRTFNPGEYHYLVRSIFHLGEQS